MELRSDFGERTINELSLMFQKGQINLEPGFQRQSVWVLRDRERLIQSILSNYPVPCIFLYRRNHRGRLVYDGSAFSGIGSETRWRPGSFGDFRTEWMIYAIRFGAFSRSSSRTRCFPDTC